MNPLLLSLLIFLSGCVSPCAHWQNRAREIANSPQYANYDCKGRTGVMIGEMSAEKVNFSVSHDCYDNTPHRSLKIGECRVDPGNPDGDFKKYGECK